MCLTLMVTAVLEVSRGVKNLGLHGASAGIKSYPNYGQYIPIDYMKAFLHGLPYMWADKKYYDVKPNMLVMCKKRSCLVQRKLTCCMNSCHSRMSTTRHIKILLHWRSVG